MKTVAGKLSIPSLTLPTGLRVTLDWLEIERRASAHEERASAATIRRALELLTEPVLSDASGAPVDVEQLALRDGLALVAVLCKAGLLTEPRIEIRCENCGDAMSTSPSDALELGPFVDDELSDPELDARFDFDSVHRIPPVFTSAGVARSVRLSPRTVGELRLLIDAGPRPVQLTRAAVIALGVSALGRERTAAGIARSLSSASDDAWTELGELWEAAHHGGRLVTDAYCKCGARNGVLAPSDRLFDRVSAAVDAPDRESAGFMSLGEFEQEVERARRSVYAARQVRNIALIVDAGVPVCDDGGEPLLGSYVPPHPDAFGAGDQGAEITLFYRSFQSEFRLDPTFDVRAEIRETIDHEVEHHLFFLSGHDPMDAEERAVIARDRERVVGKKELERRNLRGLGADLGGFVRVAFPLLALLVGLAILRNCLA